MLKLKTYFLILSIFVHLAFNALAEDSLKLGAILMLTGDQAVYGQSMREGMELAVDEISRGGKRIEIFYEDSKLDPKTALISAKRLIEIKKVHAILDASFIEVMANGAYLQRSKVPGLVLWDAAPEIELLGDYIFSIGIWAPSSAELAATFAYQHLNARKAAIINSQAEWPESAKKYFKAKFEALGGSIVASESVNPKESDFRSLITRVMNLQPDVLYSPMTENINPFYGQLSQLKFSVPIVTSDIIADEHIKIDPKVFQGIWQTMPPDPYSERSEDLMNAYEKKYEKLASLPLMVALGYDGVRLVFEAAAKIINRSTIRDRLASTREFSGSSAVISMNKQRSSPLYEEMFKINRGKFEKQ